MGKGKQYELDLKKAINSATNHWVKAHRPDFSGSSAGEVADLIVLWQAERYSQQRPSGHPERHVAYIESKKRQGEGGKRTTVMSGSSNDQSGLKELRELRMEAPGWVDTYVAIKFDHRELVVLDAEALEHWLRRDEEGWGHEQYDGLEIGRNFHSARLTPLDNISMVKPSLDWWPSSAAGEPDWLKLCKGIGLETYDFKHDEI